LIIHQQMALQKVEKLAQLEILYELREKKIQEMAAEMNALRDDTGREIRILKHQLSSAQGMSFMFLCGPRVVV
jgi:hypothetical protein